VKGRVVVDTAIQHGCPLVTHNPRHFQSIEGLDLVTAPK
jgi:predicted nucleic acid-binding protein